MIRNNSGLIFRPQAIVAIVSSYVDASGGTVSYAGNYRFHTFTNVGDTNFVVTVGGDVSCLVVAGGGGGGGYNGSCLGGGGGGGQLKEQNITIAAITYAVTVGDGGTGSVSATGNNGNDSKIGALITSTKGSGGLATTGGSSGSGSGGGNANSYCGGGGGGQGGAGGNGNNSTGTGGPGGIGAASQLTMNRYAGGGGGGTNGSNRGSAQDGGGQGGASGSAGSIGTSNTGGGGGGRGNGGSTGAKGGSGIVIIRYKYANNLIPQSGLVASWGFEGSVIDSINGYTLSNFDNYGGATPVIGYRSGKILNGINNAASLQSYGYLNSTNSTLRNYFAGRNPFTASSWIYSNNAAGQEVGGPFSGDAILGIAWGGNSLVYYDRNGTSHALLGASLVGWHHIVTTYDGTIEKAYVDNVEKYSATNTTSVTISDIGFELFKDSGVDIKIIDQAYIWNRALNTSEISTLWNNGNGL
jgi:hypothetical protein